MMKQDQEASKLDRRRKSFALMMGYVMTVRTFVKWTESGYPWSVRLPVFGVLVAGLIYGTRFVYRLYVNPDHTNSDDTSSDDLS